MKLILVITQSLLIIHYAMYGGLLRPVADAVPARESALITHLVKEANQPGAYSEGDVYLLVTVGKTAYIAELRSTNLVSTSDAKVPSGGFCRDYAEVNVKLLDLNRKETSQGAAQVLRWQKNKWKMIALSEGDYACDKLKGIPQEVRKCLNVECN
ncbi:MAG: hypothetical protein ABIN80_04210 [Dyadobacter sp.]|uniref:hypothetical protein n=1 Tax=Dyadobacter sp. TaxID=1914288 RepID=UPI003265B9BF